jgi:iron(II)-dependent oxidoreductase
MLRTRLRDARAQTDSLFQVLVSGAIYDRPIPERHRLVFYLGHLEAFDWNQIARRTLDLASFHPEFDRLFELGIDPPPGQAPQDQPGDWPQVQEIQDYNRCVRLKLDQALDQAPQNMVQMAIEHRLMHAETLAYLLHQLPYPRKQTPAYSESETCASDFPI